MSVQTLTNHESVVGGWSSYNKLTSDDRHIFDEAIKGIVGVKYSPNSVSKQLVAGMNYRFKCTASMPPAEVVWEALVDIFKPLNGKPYVTGITRI